MKKFWLTGLIFLSFVLLAGCQEDNLEVSLGTVEVEVVNLLGEVVKSENVTFELTTEASLLEILDQAMDIDYTVYEMGSMIHGVEGNYPTEYGVTYNYWYAIYVDDVMSNVGIDDIELVDGIKLSFKESTMLDETDQWVDDVIYAFIDEYIDLYITADAASYHVMAAIKQLFDRGYVVPELSTESYAYPSLSEDTIANLFKSSVTAYAFDLPTTSLSGALTTMTSTNHYDSVSLLNAYHVLGTTPNPSIIDDLIQSTPTYMDADYAGMVLNALSPYQEDSEVELFMNDMLDYIQDHLTLNGVESWGNPNASSTAAVVLGLVATGINPRSSEYTSEGNDLIEALKLYEIDATYKYLLSDEQADLAFSTPQVFAALVAYKLYRDVWGNPATNLFIPYQ